MKYDDALKAWGAKQLAHTLIKDEEIDTETFRVELQADSGWGCSCSSSAEAEVSMQAYTKDGRWVYYDTKYFDFEDFLKEVCEAANGAVTLD